MDKSRPLSILISEAKIIIDETLSSFGNLTFQQLNWQPNINQWSIAQCFDHLITANISYFPVFEKILSGEKKNSFLEKIPLLPNFWGKMLIKAVAPESPSKLKAPKVFQPSNSSIDSNIISRFIDQQNQVLKYMKATEGLDLEKIIISSPVSSLITYSLIDAYTVIVNHEQRHFLQAKRVLSVVGFPT